MSRIAVVRALRTPIGRFFGGLSTLSSADLGTSVVTALLAGEGVAPGEVDLLIFGNGRQAGGGPNPARQISHRSGLGDDCVAYTMNMACASGLKSIVLAAQAIENGEAEIAVAGGTESMSRLPYLLDRAREGYRMGSTQIVDAMYRDGFFCPLADQLMGRTAENLAERDGITRAEQDAYAVSSQHRCERARKDGAFDAEIAPVTVSSRKGDTVVRTDEHPRDGVTVEKMAKLPAVFKEGGGVHAGNSSGITDGAAAVLLMKAPEAKRRGLEVLGFLEGHAAAGVDPRYMGIGPVPATAKLTESLGIGLDDFDLIELNEAFAAQVLACLRAWGIEDERVNVNGGAIALGHPIGATGARIVVTLLHAMKARKAHRGLATLCVSGGMGQSVSFLRA